MLNSLPKLSQPRSFSIFDDDEYLKSTILIKDSEYAEESAAALPPEINNETDKEE